MEKRISMIQDKILKILSTQTENNGYVCGKNLIYPCSCVVGHYVNPAQIRREIQLLRKMGYPIIADQRGYKWTNNIQELKDYCKSRYTELDDEYDTINAMENQLWNKSVL